MSRRCIPGRCCKELQEGEFLPFLLASSATSIVLIVCPITRLQSIMSVLLPTLAAGYALLYGIRYTYHIYALTNLNFLWLAVNNSKALASAVEMAVGKTKRRSSVLRKPAGTPIVPRSGGGSGRGGEGSNGKEGKGGAAVRSVSSGNGRSGTGTGTGDGNGSEG